MEKKTKFTKVDEDILNELFPPRLNDDDEEWDWSDYDGFADEIIPWSFSSSEIRTEEEFLVLYHAWNAIHPSMSFTSTDRLPYREETIHQSYEYIVHLYDTIWRVGINENMGLEYLFVEQHLPKHYKIESIRFEIVGTYWYGGEEVDLNAFPQDND